MKTFSFNEVQSTVHNLVENNKSIQRELYHCQVCHEVARPIYRMIFLVKDESTLGLDKIYKIHFYSYHTQAEDFFGGLKPTNLYKDSIALQKIKDYIRLLTRFNLYVDCIVRRKSCSSKFYEDLFELYDGKLLELPVSTSA